MRRKKVVDVRPIVVKWASDPYGKTVEHAEKPSEAIEFYLTQGAYDELTAVSYQSDESKFRAFERSLAPTHLTTMLREAALSVKVTKVDGEWTSALYDEIAPRMSLKEFEYCLRNCNDFTYEAVAEAAKRLSERGPFGRKQ